MTSSATAGPSYTSWAEKPGNPPERRKRPLRGSLRACNLLACYLQNPELVIEEYLAHTLVCVSCML